MGSRRESLSKLAGLPMRQHRVCLSAPKALANALIVMIKLTFSRD